jgi:flagellar hook-basal body complex protein FliE
MNISSVSSAVSSVSNTNRTASAPVSSTVGDFASMLHDIGKGAVRTLEIAETNSRTALSGQGSTREVVEAVMSAEQTLQIAVGIRDKIVSAYLELSRMAI